MENDQIVTVLAEVLEEISSQFRGVSKGHLSSANLALI